VILRFQLPHAALAVFYSVDRSTVTRAVHETRPLLAARGFAVPGEAGLRLHTLADVFAYATAKGVELRLDGTEVRVRRPEAGRPGRRAFVSGKMRQNTKKATVITDGQGRTLWTGAVRPGRMHDQTAVKTEGIEALFEQYPQVKAKVDAGYRGLAKRFPDQVQAPPKKPAEDASAEEVTAWEAAPQEAILGADMRRARQRRAQTVEAPPAVPRPPRVLHRDPSGHRRPRLRPHRRAVITYQPTRQANTPQPQSRMTPVDRLSASGFVEKPAVQHDVPHVALVAVLGSDAPAVELAAEPVQAEAVRPICAEGEALALACAGPLQDRQRNEVQAVGDP
jgi:hypothetical protein